MKIYNCPDLKINHKILDDIVPSNTPSKIPNFKQQNINKIRENCREGDEIVIIGGGNGVSAVHSARIVGSDGGVTIYEGDEERIRDLKQTLKHNGVSDICDINHSIVGQAHMLNHPVMQM